MAKSELAKLAQEIRVNIVNCIGSLGVGHIGGCLSIADVSATANAARESSRLSNRIACVCQLRSLV